MSESRRRLAVILFADIQGYTSLMERDESNASSLLRRFQSEIEEQTANYHGEIINFYGDGVLCAFNDPVDAAHCAVGLQKAFQKEPNVPVRIGIHSGTVVFESGKIFGNSVNIASRIESMGLPGAILVSKKVRDELRNQPDFELKILGEFEFKNLNEPLEVFALANEGLVVPDASDMRGKIKKYDGQSTVDVAPASDKWFARGLQIVGAAVILAGIGYTIFFRSNNANAKTQEITFINAEGEEETRTFLKKEFRNSLPIFPFEQNGGDSLNPNLGLALAFAVGIDLDQDKYLDMDINFFRTGTRSTDFSTVDKINHAKSYSDAHYVDGSYRFENGEYTLRPVIRTKSNGNSIAERSFRSKDYMFLIDSASLFIKEALGFSEQKIAESVDLPFREMVTESSEAFENMIKGLRDYDFRSFEEALEIDTTFALASYLYSTYSYGQGSIEARYEIERALRHRKRLPYTWQIEILSDNHLIKKNWEKAEQLLLTQVDIDPTDTETLGSLSNLYMIIGQYDKMYQMKKRIFEIDPGGGNRLEVAQAALINGQKDEAAQFAEAFLENDPQNIFALFLLSEVRLHQGNYPAAKALLEKITLFNPGNESLIQTQIDAITYLEQHPDYFKRDPFFTGTFKLSSSGMTFTITEVNGFAYNRAENQGGFFTYPYDSMSTAYGGVTTGFINDYQLDSQGEVMRVKFTQNNAGNSWTYYGWKQDSLIWKAEKLLKQRKYPEALVAYEQAIEQNPAHFYLRQALEHIRYVQNQDPEILQSRLRKIAGEYGEAKFWVENGQLIYKRKGLGRRTFLPISDNRFITLQANHANYVFLERAGKPYAVTAYDYDVEQKTWVLEEDWYYEKQGFLN